MQLLSLIQVSKSFEGFLSRRGSYQQQSMHSWHATMAKVRFASIFEASAAQLHGYVSKIWISFHFHCKLQIIAI
jgi:hypothetical protein